MPVQSIDIQTADGTMDAKLFSPEGQGPWPGVVMISDAGGTRPAFEAMAQQPPSASPTPRRAAPAASAGAWGRIRS